MTKCGYGYFCLRHSLLDIRYSSQLSSISSVRQPDGRSRAKKQGLNVLPFGNRAYCLGSDVMGDLQRINASDGTQTLTA
jgi:hypothetical protein